MGHYLGRGRGRIDRGARKLKSGNAHGTVHGTALSDTDPFSGNSSALINDATEK